MKRRLHEILGECRIEAYKVEGEVPKAWYGISHFSDPMGCFVLYPIPINCIVALTRYIYLMLKTGFMLWKKPYERRVSRAYRAGYQQAVCDCNDAMAKAYYSANKTA